jgi:hypothetical protein
MSNSEHAINHCGQGDDIRRAGLDNLSFKEAVMERAGVLVREAQTGGQAQKKGPRKLSEPHTLAGVEMTAHVVAESVLYGGARQLCLDFDIDLENLIDHARSTHISSC